MTHNRSGTIENCGKRPSGHFFIPMFSLLEASEKLHYCMKTMSTLITLNTCRQQNKMLDKHLICSRIQPPDSRNTARAADAHTTLPLTGCLILLLFLLLRKLETMDHPLMTSTLNDFRPSRILRSPAGHARSHACNALGVRCKILVVDKVSHLCVPR